MTDLPTPKTTPTATPTATSTKPLVVIATWGVPREIQGKSYMAVRQLVKDKDDNEVFTGRARLLPEADVPKGKGGKMSRRFDLDTAIFEKLNAL
jgi:hypothetical protein